MLADGQKLFAYNFSGYWKDVGTISSLWEANMDVLNPASGINLDDSAWKIYARNTAEPPHFVGKNAVIRNSLVTEGCEINGKVERSVLSTGVEICEGATIQDSTIMPGAKICKGAVVKYAIVGNNAIVGENAVVGDTQEGMVDGQWQITVVGPNAVVEANQVVPVKAMVD